MKKIAAVAAIALSLGGCLGDIGTDGYSTAGAGAGGAAIGGAAVAPAPAAPMAPIAVGAAMQGARQGARQGAAISTRAMEGNEPGQREVHAASTLQDCVNMAARFKLERPGLRYRGARINPNASSKRDPLRWICMFEGEESSDSAFDDHRYNAVDEYSAETRPYEPPTVTPRTPYRGNKAHREFRRTRYRRDRPSHPSQ